MVNHSRAESLLFHIDDDGVERFDALICADGKQIHGDLLVLSCGVGARTELAHLAGLPVSTGILVDDSLHSWGDPNVYAIGDCAHVSSRADTGSGAALVIPAGAPSGLIGPGWRQADWLAATFTAELADRAAGKTRSATVVPAALPAVRAGMLDTSVAVVMLKAEGIDVVAAGNTAAEPWDVETEPAPAHAHSCDSAASAASAASAGSVPSGGSVPSAGSAGSAGSGVLSVSQWADPEHGRYVKMVTRGGVLEGFVCVGMPRTGAELTLLFERGSELPADRSVLLRYDGPDYEPLNGSDAFAADATVCWCNGVTVGAIADSAAAGNRTVSCIAKATRAGTGCGGCKGRISEVLERAAQGDAAQGDAAQGDAAQGPLARTGTSPG